MDETARSGGPSLPAGDAAASLALSGASREKADAFLDEQTRLAREQTEVARLQAEDLRDKDAFELSHLRWRQFDDRVRGVWQTGLALLVVGVLAAIALVLWNASQADGLVIDSFSAPSNLANLGIGGDVIATDLTDRIAAIRATAVSNSLNSTSAVSRSGADSVRVEIPETGVSAGEAWRLLRNWLGHERHVSGSLRELPNGTIVLSAQLGGEALSYSGTTANFTGLEQQMAEGLFDAFDPVNAVIYLSAQTRRTEAQHLAEANVRLPGSRPDRSRRYSVLGYITAWNGDIPRAIARLKIGVMVDPKYVVTHWMMAEDEALLGYDEAALAQARLTLAQVRSDQPVALRNSSFENVRARAERLSGDLLGDFSGAEAIACGENCAPDHLAEAAYYAARRHDPARAKFLLGAAEAALHLDAAAVRDARYWDAVNTGDWPGAVRAAQFSAPVFDPRAIHGALQPMLARALAEAGRFADARSVIAATSVDCYDCVRVRGEIDLLAGNASGAAYWFARAAKLAPSIPFAYADWGAMLMQKGDFDAAIAKFESAHKKGPHFADPLEMWGEALIAKNRSDLALAKFEEAARYAPNWGRLHLKWGEALEYAGDKSAAQKQFAIAARLDPTPEEKSQLARVRSTHD